MLWKNPGSWIFPQQSFKPFFVVKSTKIGIYSVWCPYGRCIELYGWSFFNVIQHNQFYGPFKIFCAFSRFLFVFCGGVSSWKCSHSSHDMSFRGLASWVGNVHVVPDCFNLEFYIGKLNFIVTLRCYCFKLFSPFFWNGWWCVCCKSCKSFGILSVVCYVSLNVEKIWACLLECNIVCFSGKDFTCLSDVRLQDFLILDIFPQISEVIFLNVHFEFID
jgi:hypothetical protein